MGAGPPFWSSVEEGETAAISDVFLDFGNLFPLAHVLANVATSDDLLADDATQLGGAAAGVETDFSRGGDDRLLGHVLPHLGIAERLFDDPVFDRVKGDDHCPATGRKNHGQNRVEESRKLVELSVHMNP